jgi:hypothetical protein
VYPQTPRGLTRVAVTRIFPGLPCTCFACSSCRLSADPPAQVARPQVRSETMLTHVTLRLASEHVQPIVDVLKGLRLAEAQCVAPANRAAISALLRTLDSAASSAAQQPQVESSPASTPKSSLQREIPPSGANDRRACTCGTNVSSNARPLEKDADASYMKCLASQARDVAIKTAWDAHRQTSGAAAPGGSSSDAPMAETSLSRAAAPTAAHLTRRARGLLSARNVIRSRCAKRAVTRCRLRVCACACMRACACVHMGM